MDYERFMKSALEAAEHALNEGEFPVGCVVSGNQRILARESRTNSKPESRNELDHAEMRALRRLVDMGPEVKRSETCFFTTLEPCLMCFSALIINGITTIVYAYEDTFGGATTLNLRSLKPFYRDLNIKVVPGILREKSLELFKVFFSNSDNSYLTQSPLAQQVLGEP